MRRLIVLSIILISTLAQAQVTKKTLELPEFRSIYVNSNYTVYLKQTNKQEVRVEAETELYDLTTITVEKGILMINMERKPDNANKSIWAKLDDLKLNPNLKLYISMKNIDELQVNGGGKIIAENSIASSKLSLSIGGGGSMDVDLKGDVLNCEVSGSGKMAIKGYATSLEGVVSGSGSIQAFNCPLETAKIKVSGSGNAELNVTSTIDALVVGSGTVKHKGNTKNATKKVYGSGAVERAY